MICNFFIFVVVENELLFSEGCKAFVLSSGLLILEKSVFLFGTESQTFVVSENCVFLAVGGVSYFLICFLFFLFLFFFLFFSYSFAFI